MILQIIFLPLVFSLVNYMHRKYYTTLLVAAVQIYVCSLSFVLFIESKKGNVEFLSGSSELLGIKFIATELSSMFVLLTSFICTIVLIYTLTRLAEHKLFVFLLFSLQSLILICFLSDDLFNIYLSLEISLLICSMLIMYKRDKRQLYDGLVYLLTNIIGMTFFLFGIGYMYKIFGTTSISKLIELTAETSLDGKALALPYAFLITGACLKSAFFPLYHWLPKAHGTPGAPSVVSAILSGVFVKCGIFLFLRVREIFLPVINLDYFFLFIGILTGVLGIVFALCQLNLKKILAYHTVSQMGLILIGISLNSKLAMNGAFLHIINHAIFKSLLFLCAGIIIKSYGTNNVTKISGVMKRMPIIGIALLGGILGITGAPFFNGSISKYFIQAGATTIFIEIVILIINLGTCLSFVKVGFMLLGDGKRESSDIFTTFSVLILAVSCFVTGVFGTQFSGFLFNYSYSISFSGYMIKAFIWILTITVSIFIYKNLIKKHKFFKKEHSPELTFNDINVLTLVFFGIILSIVTFI